MERQLLSVGSLRLSFNIGAALQLTQPGYASSEIRADFLVDGEPLPYSAATDCIAAWAQ